MTISSQPNHFILPDMPTTDDLIPYLREIDHNQWYTNFGPLSQRFEKLFAERMAQEHGTTMPHYCVAINSGTRALSLGLRFLGIKAGDNVLVPTVTFPACPLAALHIGANAILSDVDPESWTLTPAIARAAAAHNKIDAVMPVAIYGMPIDAVAWDAFTEETGIPVLIDAAAAVESQHYLNKGLVAHSLHALKPFGIGEGGMLVTSDPQTAEKAHQTINFGMKDRITMLDGENAKISEYHAAVGLAQLERWEGIKARRRQVMALYLEALAQEDRVYAPTSFKDCIPSNLMIYLKAGGATALLERLTARDIAAHRTYLPPLYDHPYFKSLSCVNAEGEPVAPDRMEGAVSMQKLVIGLPFHPFMSREEVEHTVMILSQCLDKTCL